MPRARSAIRRPTSRAPKAWDRSARVSASRWSCAAPTVFRRARARSSGARLRHPVHLVAGAPGDLVQLRRAGRIAARNAERLDFIAQPDIGELVIVLAV